MRNLVTLAVVVIGSLAAVGCSKAPVSDDAFKNDLTMQPVGNNPAPGGQGSKVPVVKPVVVPVVGRGGVPDDSVKPSNVRGSVPDDSIKPVTIPNAPTNNRTGTADEGVKTGPRPPR